MEQHEISRRLDGVKPRSLQEMAVLMEHRADMARERGMEDVSRRFGMQAGAAANEVAANTAAEGIADNLSTGQQAARIAIGHSTEATPIA